MSRFTAFATSLVLAFVVGCTQPGEPIAKVPPETFVGSWRSTTAPHEHLRLTVQPPAPMGWLGTRLTFSGVAWEGAARIEGDSLILDATTSSRYGAAVIAHPAEGGALRVRVESYEATPLTLIFIRGE